LNRIPHPWTLLGSDLDYLGLDSSLLEHKVLIPLWTRTLFQFRLIYSIFSLSSPGQLTQVTFTLSAYPNLARTAYPIFTRAPYLSTSMLTQPYTFKPGRITLLNSSPDRTYTYPALLDQITLPDPFPIGLLSTRSYPATLPDFLTMLGNTLLHSTAYPGLPNHLTRPGTLQLASLENFLISLPP
jgi:hypothetical protein